MMIKTIISLLLITCASNIAFTQSNTYRTTATARHITLGITDSLQSSILGEQRNLAVYLPEGYSPDSAATYPVIYLLDGGAQEDFMHVAGLVQYYTTPWVNQFPKSIIVGIENVNRKRDFTFATPNLDFVTKMGYNKNDLKLAGGSAKFIAFIEKELQPFIQAHYKVNNSKTIIGESLGGLLATEILFKYPSLFDTYIIISPSLWWNDESLLKEPAAIAKQSFTGKLKIYIGAANKTESQAMFTDAQQLATQIKKYNRPNIRVNFDYLPGEKHATIIHQAVYNAFKILYSKTKNG